VFFAEAALLDEPRCGLDQSTPSEGPCLSLIRCCSTGPIGQCQPIDWLGPAALTSHQDALTRTGHEISQRESCAKRPFGELQLNLLLPRRLRMRNRSNPCGCNLATVALQVRAVAFPLERPPETRLLPGRR